jgi:hypothetical protein
MLGERIRTTRATRIGVARILLVVAMGGAAAACNLLVDLAGLAGGPASDGGVDVASASDAPNGADAPPGSDASDGSTPDADASPPPYALAVLADHPLAYLRFEEQAAPLKDTANGGASWTPVGGPLLALAGRVGGGAEFDGGNRFELAAGLDFPGTAPYTMEAWVDAFVGDTSYRRLLGGDYKSQTGDREAFTILVVNSGGGDAITVERFANGTNLATAAPYTRNEWHHVAHVYDGTQLLLYLDGVQSRSAPDTQSRPPAPTPFQVGGFGSGFPEFAGRLDEVAVYGQALSAGQIAAHFAAAPP